ncbi:hypothetical protein L3Q67_19375 [Saccharothrix sp. AJ9571]|nr:hypothetical protein L3Q67_19375 [Saccharothrix sp. AJ9571]
MAEKVGRVALGVLSVLAVLGGGALVVMVIVYFGASEYVPELNEIGGWGMLAGPVALAVYTAGAFEAPLVARVSAGIGLMLGTFAASTLVAHLVSLTADRGGPRGNLEDGTLGFLWFLAGAFFLWRLALRRWPVSEVRSPR